MDLNKVAQQLSIPSYPDQMKSILPSQEASCICSPEWVDQLEHTYQVFGKYHLLVRKAAEALQMDKDRLYWGQVAATYFAGCNVSEARQIPMPMSDDTLAGDFLPLLILMTQLKNGIAEYRQRGMPEDMIRRNLDHFVDGISIVESRIGRPAIDQTYFNWLCKFIKATLYNSHGFNFEIRAFPRNVCVLQDLNKNALLPVIISGDVHHSGLISGSAGCEDQTESYCPQFKETDEYYWGHPCINGLVEATPQYFSKDQFQAILMPGDPVVSVHIPRGTDISKQNAAQALKAGFKESQKYYPEHRAKTLYCHSWLLDPTFRQLLRPGANIPDFGDLFTRFPAKSAGAEVFSFVFNKKMPYGQLPENTSLERALKKHYLQGKHILAYSGIALPEQL